MAVEEQTQHNKYLDMYAGSTNTRGQKLTIANRKVTKLGFWLYKVGSPTGDVTFEIRKVADDSLICSKVWGAAADLSTETTYEEAELDTPPTINEEVRIVCVFKTGNSSNKIVFAVQDTNVKANECYTGRSNAAWTDVGTYDTAYKYTWEEPSLPAAGGGPAALVAAGII